MTYTRTFISVFCAILLFAIFPMNGFPSMCWWDIEKGVVDELATTDIVSLACSYNSGCLDNNSESCLKWLNILSEMDMPVRAIPLLESAFRHMEKSGSDYRDVADTLFNAYLSVGEWNKAENMLPDISTQMSPGMLMDYMGRLAISAAQAGAARDAIRLWHKRCNLDLTDLCGLDDLAQKGLRDALRDYYISLKKRDPESWVPDSALSKLQ